jgi:hypothetical protein
VHFEIKGEDWRLFHRGPSSADQEDGEKQHNEQSTYEADNLKVKRVKGKMANTG